MPSKIAVAGLAAGLLLFATGAASAETKEEKYQQMLDLAQEIAQVKPSAAGNPSAQATLDSLLAQYRQLSQSMGGDDPARVLGGSPVNGSESPDVAPPPPTGCANGAAGAGSNNTPVPIPDSGGPVATSTIAIAGAGPFLWDLDLTVNITHTFPADLDLTVTSPAGTIVTISSDNGGSNDNVWAGTTFDDDANPGGQVPYSTNAGLVGDHPYAAGVVATPLVPEEAFAAFIGEDPNGTWTITLDDDLGGDTGTLNSWSLAITTLAEAPIYAGSIDASNTTPLPIPDSGGATVSNTATLSGAETFTCGVTLTANVTHTFPSDLDFTLMSPAGTILTVSSDNAGSNDNVWAGTIFDVDADPDGQVPYATNAGLVNDHPYATGVVASPLVAEESFGALIGEDPNGTWTMTADDDLGGDTGTLNSWTVSVRTCTCGCVLTLACPADQFATAPPGAASTTVTYPDPTVGGTCANVTVSCVPASGDPFLIGTTPVVCTAVDAATGTNASCTFNVTVDTQTLQEIPTASAFGLGALALLLAAAAFVALRKSA